MIGNHAARYLLSSLCFAAVWGSRSHKVVFGVAMCVRLARRAGPVIIPNFSVQLPPSCLRGAPAPLLEEEGTPRHRTDREVRDPIMLHSPSTGARLAAGDDPVEFPRGPPSQAARAAAPRKRTAPPLAPRGGDRCEIGNVLISTLTPIQRFAGQSALPPAPRAARPLGQHLVGVLRCLRHHREHVAG